MTLCLFDTLMRFMPPLATMPRGMDACMSLCQAIGQHLLCSVVGLSDNDWLAWLYITIKHIQR